MLHELRRGQDAAGLFRQLVFLGFGVDELAAAILVARLDQDLAGGCTFAFERDLHSSRGSQAYLGSCFSSTEVLFGSGGQEPSPLGLTEPADAAASDQHDSLIAALGSIIWALISRSALV